MSSLLAWLKQQSAPTSILLMAKDDEAKRLMVAWSMYHPKFKDLTYDDSNLDDLNVSFALYELWAEEVDYHKLSRMANVPVKNAPEIFSRLREALLVFPDGTISNHATAVLTAEATSWLRPLLTRSER